MRVHAYPNVRWDLESYFRALGDPTRLRIVNLLLHGELCGCDIQYVLEASQSNVSRHLTYLKNGGLLLDRREGYRIFYRLAAPHERIRKQLFSFLRTVFNLDETLRLDTARLKAAIEHGSCTAGEWRPFAGLVSVKTIGVRS